MKINRMILMAAALCMTVSMTGCGNGTEDTASEENTSPAVTEAAEETVENTETAAETTAPEETETETETTPVEEELPEVISFPSELTDDIMDMRMMMYGTVIALPCTAESFVEAGWEIMYEQEIVIPAGQFYTTAARRPDTNANVQVTFYNGGNSEITLSTPEGKARAKCVHMQIWHMQMPRLEESELPRGIQPEKSTYDDVIAAYGEPQETEELSPEFNNPAKQIIYKNDIYSMKLKFVDSGTGYILRGVILSDNELSELHGELN
ncbi:MAG: hypothetical protein J6M17_10520 [Ruminococcus sp.]|nr:hypothetical protein [Ruminococcus sp.]